MTRHLGRCAAVTTALVLLGSGGRPLPSDAAFPTAASPAGAAVVWASPHPPETPGETPPLVNRVREALERERDLLLAYTYRERRRPVKVSALGKVSVGEEHIYAVHPSSDPDRPRRVLLTVGGRPASDDEREEARRREESAHERLERERRDAERRKRAAERLDDAFRVYAFTPGDVEVIDGIAARVVEVVPRADVETTSDVGKWMKKFRGQAWIDEATAQLLRIEMVATDSISIGWGVIGRIAEGTSVRYERRPIANGLWFPVTARFTARGRTLLFRAFDIDSRTEWYDYRPATDAAAPPASPASEATGPALPPSADVRKL
jgi:hypothetical protein